MGTLDLGGKHGRHRGYSSLVLPSLPSPPFLSYAEDCGGIPAWLEYPPTRLRHARGGGGRAGDGGDARLPWKALEGGEGKLITWYRH